MTGVKFICSLALLSGALATSVSAAEATGEQRARAAGRAILGAPAPRLMLSTIDGDAIDLGNLYGKKAVYLKFWATWCVPCREQMPHFQHVYETAGPDMAVVAVDVGFNDSIEAIRAFRKKLGITMPIVFDDGGLGAAFHLRVTPTHVVIGRDGRIQYVGHLADQELDAALIAARAAAPAARVPHAAAVANDDAPPIGVGDLLPKRSLRTLDGERFDFIRGADPSKLTVLVFLSPWCESYLATTRPEVSANCRSVRAQLSDLSADPHVRSLGIASGLWANSQDLRQYRAENKIAIPLTLDASGSVFRAFRVNNVPTVLIADADGRIVRRIEGAPTRNAAALRTAIEGL
ncbi:MAG TPA: TlpA disulfide reductase family protein [Steroidobacteraceae bacterium]|jgi:thiol-disulfide isomerase/thioredoxin|nr:TlpA disulfide reductase family protein [Steroidobacteraceae bacterium]